MPGFDPVVLLAMWAAGLSAAGAVVAGWRVVGPGYLWLTGGVGLLVGLVAGFAHPLGVVGLAALAVAVVAARRVAVAAAAFLAASAAFLMVAALRDAVVPAVTGTLALGGITSEMMLGHWYLVDPRLPRWALRRLDVVGAVGVAADVAVAWVRGLVPAPVALLGVSFLALAVVTLLLAVGVWFSLREKGYEGVMAATGLSYLATLTVLAVVILGRTGGLP